MDHMVNTGSYNGGGNGHLLPCYYPGHKIVNGYRGNFINKIDSPSYKDKNNQVIISNKILI